LFFEANDMEVYLSLVEFIPLKEHVLPFAYHQIIVLSIINM